MRQILKHWQFYAMVSLPVLYIAVFKYLPIVGMQMAFREYNVRDGMWGSKWVGLHYFSSFYHSPLTAVEYLIRLGHRRIAYIGGPAVSIEREFGYRKALIMHGLHVTETLIRLVNGQSFQDGYEAMRSLLETGEVFEGLFCGNDLLAFGAIKAMEEAGLRVPDDVSVVGYDDIFSARLFKPALTTVRQPIADIGKELVSLLLQAIETEPDRRTVRKIIIPTELIVRESTALNSE